MLYIAIVIMKTCGWCRKLGLLHELNNSYTIVRWGQKVELEPCLRQWSRINVEMWELRKETVIKRNLHYGCVEWMWDLASKERHEVHSRHKEMKYWSTGDEWKGCQGQTMEMQICTVCKIHIIHYYVQSDTWEKHIYIRWYYIQSHNDTA